MAFRELGLSRPGVENISPNPEDKSIGSTRRQEFRDHLRTASKILMPDGPQVFVGKALLSYGLRGVAAPLICAFPPAALGVEVAVHLIAKRLQTRSQALE